MVYRGLKYDSKGEEIDTEERMKNYSHSIALATKAIALDMNDS